MAICCEQQNKNVLNNLERERDCQSPIEYSLIKLAQSLQREIQVVKETLQTVLVQLQSAKEAGEEKAGDFLCDSWCPGKQDLKE